MTTPTRPPGYRAPTEEQLKRMPPGSLCLHHDENMHATWEPLAEFPSQADDWVFLAYQAGQLAVPDTKEVNYLNDFDPHTGRPNGYREPTDTDMECLPEGTLCWVSPRWVIHGDVGLPAKPGKGKKSFAVPDGIVRKAAMVEASTGAKREDKTGRGAFHLIPPIAERALAKRFEDGAVHHGPSNWQKGIPLSSYYNAVRRHTLQAAEGATDEDHFGAALWNLSCWLWTENEIKEGRLPAELNDLPYHS